MRIIIWLLDRQRAEKQDSVLHFQAQSILKNKRLINRSEFFVRTSMDSWKQV